MTLRQQVDDGFYQHVVNFHGSSSGATLQWQRKLFADMKLLPKTETYRLKAANSTDFQESLFDPTSATRAGIYDVGAIIADKTTHFLAPTKSFPVSGNRQLMSSLNESVVTFSHPLMRSARDV